MKRKWLLLLALACCVMLAAGILAACHKLPAEQPDANLPTPSEGLEYGINNDGQSYEVTGIGECEDTALVIPQTYNGLPVTSIGACAFENCTGLISVTIPDSVTSIGRYAFSYCSGLTSVIIPDSVTSIGEGAFQYCFGLTSVIIGKGVTSIGDRAFYYCSDLTSVIIPDSVTSIGDEAFSGCSELESITVEEGNSVYYSAGNCLIETASKTLIAGCKTSIIPDDGSVTSIGRYAFYNCSSLTSITIPDSVTSIGWQAFLGCSNITSATMPTLAIDHIPQDSLQTVVLTSGESIGRYAFYDSHLTSVTIPDSVTSIGSGAFEDCWGLTSITIPDSVTSIGYDAFSACYKLVEVYNKSSLNIVAGSTGHGYVGYYAKNVYKETGGSWFTDTEDGFRFFYDGKQGYLMEYNGSETEIDLPTSFTAYDRTLVKSYTIYKYAFYNCSSLTSVTIPDSVTSIGDWAFAYCDGLTSIAIPDSVTSIERGAFEGCRGLTSITIPDTVTSIGDYAFRGCSSLESITIPFVGATKDGTEDTHFGYIFGASDYSGNGSSVPASLKEVIITGGTRIGFSAFSGCSSLTSIAIPDSVTSIGEDAFYRCSSLTSITIPDSVTSIGYRAFYGCTGLTSITIPDSVTSIEGGAFNSCSGLTSITISDSVTRIGSSAFSGCSSLTSITIPNSVTIIGENAFYNCSGLTSITVEEGNSVYHSAGNCIIETESKTLVAGCKASVLPDDGSVTSIGEWAFAVCSGLISITIPDSVTSIGYGAFWDCTGLTSITIPDSVTSIGRAAFDGCRRLTSVTFEGTTAEWDAVTKGGYWNYSCPFTKVVCTNGTVSV